MAAVGSKICLKNSLASDSKTLASSALWRSCSPSAATHWACVPFDSVPASLHVHKTSNQHCWRITALQEFHRWVHCTAGKRIAGRRLLAVDARFKSSSERCSQSPIHVTSRCSDVAQRRGRAVKFRAAESSLHTQDAAAAIKSWPTSPTPATSRGKMD